MGSFSLVICFGLSLALFYYIGKRKVNQNKEKDDIPLEQSDSSYPSHTGKFFLQKIFFIIIQRIIFSSKTYYLEIS